jgi:membrane glycosyltransferase
LFGLALLTVLAWLQPTVIMWFVPFVGGLVLAVPFAVIASSPSLGQLAAGLKLSAMPEEFKAPADLAGIIDPVLDG